MSSISPLDAKITSTPFPYSQDNTSPQFQYDGHENEMRKYRINEEALSPDECHLFFPSAAPPKFIAVISAMSHITFHPKGPLAQKLQFDEVSCEGEKLFWCHFPKEFKEVCERAAKIYQMAVRTSAGMNMVCPGASISIRIAFSDRILGFFGRQDDMTLYPNEKELVDLGNVLENLKLD